jgi:hypothetical protein
MRSSTLHRATPFFPFLVVVFLSMPPALASDCNGQSSSELQSGKPDAVDCDGKQQEGTRNNASFLSSIDWRWRLGLTDFRVEDSNAFGVAGAVKGLYETAHGVKLKLFLSTIVDNDRDHLDSDHIPVWFKNYLKAEKEWVTFGRNFNLDATLDLNHKMNTLSSIEQSADLMPGIKLDFETARIGLFAKLSAGFYYLEIDDDLPEEYSDYRRDDLDNSEFAWSQEYHGRWSMTDRFTVTGKYKDFRNNDGETLETREKLKFSFRLNVHQLVAFAMEKTEYNLDQFERSAGDNGLQILPFNKDTFYQAYFEYDY